MSDEFDFAGTAQEEAQVASGKLNFGKLKITPRFVQWKDNQPTEIDAATYANLGARERSLEYVFTVDIQEFKPELQFTYERKVQVGGLDWSKILKPSLEAVCGKGSSDKELLAATLRSLNGRYVCAEDVPQTPTTKKPDRAKYSTVQLAALYDTREACHAAWQEKYGAQAAGAAGSGAAHGSASGGLDVPPGYTAETWAKQAEDLRKLRVKYIQGGKSAHEATDAAASEYGASGAQVAKLLGIEYQAEAQLPL